MKLIQILMLMLLVMESLAQTTKSKKSSEDKCETKLPLPPNAFNKMIVQDITYAIIGENTPVSGIKVDISKPEATISGVFKPKKDKTPWDLFSFEFKGGATDRSFNLFKGFNSFNTAFEFRPSFHFIPAKSSATYGYCEEARPKTLIIDAKNRQVKRNATSLIDSFYVIALIRKHHLDSIPGLVDSKTALSTVSNTPDSSLKKIILHFLKKIKKNDALTIDGNLSIDSILKANMRKASIVNNEINIDTYYDDVNEFYKKYQLLYTNLETDTLNKIINNASEIWTSKKYVWFTVTPFIRTEKVNEFYRQYEGKDSSHFKSDYRFYYGITGYINRYIVLPNIRAHFIRAGVSLSRNNNLTTLTSYNYETTNPFFSYGTAVTEKTKSGTAYNHDDIKTGFLKQLILEYYRLPLTSLKPGIYASTNINISDLYRLPNIIGRENDKVQLGLEGGTVFNINSREKDKEKSILSLLFYIRHEDLTDKRRTPQQTGEKESWDDYRKRNLSIGIRVGIPINLPQRSS